MLCQCHAKVLSICVKVPTTCVKVVSELSQSCAKVVSKWFQSCPKVVSNLSQTGVGWGCRILNRAQRVDHLKVRMAIRAPNGAQKTQELLKKCSPCLSLFSPAQPSVFLVGVG